MSTRQPSPHPWKISPIGQTSHDCNVKILTNSRIQRENMKDGVVCDRSMPLVVFCCNSKLTIAPRQHQLKNKPTFSTSFLLSQ